MCVAVLNILLSNKGDGQSAVFMRHLVLKQYMVGIKCLVSLQHYMTN